MKDRIVIWGQDEKDEDILIAIRLLQDSDIIKIWTFPKKEINTEFVDQLFQEWKEGDEINFPQPHQLMERGIGEENMLPEHIKTPKTDVIKIAEQEWRVRVLSFRLYQHIKQQIEQLDTRVGNLSVYSKDIWEEAKDLSRSIRENTLDRNIKKGQTTELRKSLDTVFEKLKKLQNAEHEKYLDVSKTYLGDFRQKIKDVIDQIGKGNTGKKLFDQLIQYQQEVKGLEMTIRDRNALRLNFNEAFEVLKSARQSNYGSRMNARVNGLKSAIGKMEASIKRDRDNINYQTGRLGKSNTTQLEHQLRSAKLKLIEDRIQSKEQKLNGMYLTLKDLERKADKATSKSKKVVLPNDKKLKTDKSNKEVVPSEDKNVDATATEKPREEVDVNDKPTSEENIDGDKAKQAEPETKKETSNAQLDPEKTASKEVQSNETASKAIDEKASHENIVVTESEKAKEKETSETETEKTVSIENEPNAVTNIQSNEVENKESIDVNTEVTESEINKEQIITETGTDHTLTNESVSVEKVNEEVTENITDEAVADKAKLVNEMDAAETPSVESIIDGPIESIDSATASKVELKDSVLENEENQILSESATKIENTIGQTEKEKTNDTAVKPTAKESIQQVLQDNTSNEKVEPSIEKAKQAMQDAPELQNISSSSIQSVLGTTVSNLTNNETELPTTNHQNKEDGKDEQE